MDITWEITKNDIDRLNDFVNQNQGLSVEIVMERNISRSNIVIDKDKVIKTMLLCLMIAQKRSDVDNRVGVLINAEPFPMSFGLLDQATNIETILHNALKENGLTRYLSKVPYWFTTNYCLLENTEWDLLTVLNEFIEKPGDKYSERIVADAIDRMFKGFGSTRSRIFLQTLGLTKYEIPIDLLTMKWLKEFRFPISFSAKALQDIHFFHLVSDGIQLLCEKAGIYPCILDAAIVSNNTSPEMMKNYYFS